jgi:diguanylate cyclase (GGDEF)-like protein
MNLPHFSYDSLVLMTIVNLLTTGTVMLFVWNAGRPGPGLTSIAIGDLLLGIGLLISVLRNLSPTVAILLLSNFALFAGSVFLLTGIRAFRGFPALPVSALSAGSAAYLSALSYWVLVHNQRSARVVLVSLVLAAGSVAMGMAMARELPSEDRRLYIFAASLFGIHSVALTMRAVWAFTHTMSNNVLAGGPADFTVMFTMNLVTTGSGIAVAVASNRKLYHTTKALAMRDPLTNLPNRRMLDERLADLREIRFGTWPGVALIYLDLDDFKTINDSLGHHLGDEVLRVFAQRLRSFSAGHGFPARLGGDEFILLFEGIGSRAAACDLMNEVLRFVQQDIVVGNQKLAIKVSCGLAVYPDDVKRVSDLVNAADTSMYREKRDRAKIASFPNTRLRAFSKPAS